MRGVLGYETLLPNFKSKKGWDGQRFAAKYLYIKANKDETG